MRNYGTVAIFKSGDTLPQDTRNETQKTLSTLETGGSQTLSGFRADDIKVSTTVSRRSRRVVFGRQCSPIEDL